MPANKKKKTTPANVPEWHPTDAGPAFASAYVSGKDKDTQRTPATPGKRRSISTADFEKGILKGDRTLLGRALTLVESNAAAHQQQAQELLTRLLPHSGNALRIGITGVPGAGKSTFIETLGLFLIEAGHRVAVLAIDPSSSLSGGSILGDKTRMEKLSQNEGSFIRPSPSGGALGGVARKTRESMLICEAAGYDVVFIETIGVGQSEIAVRSMVDFFLLLQIAGGGDDLQGIKKGVMELADAVVINKADGDNLPRANAAKRELEITLRYLTPYAEGWQPKALTCSALTGAGIAEIWQLIETFQTFAKGSGLFYRQRRLQLRQWLRDMLKEGLERLFLQHPEISEQLPALEDAVISGDIPAATAAQKLLQLFKAGS